MTPCVPVGIVVFCPLGIWIASQSRLNVNSVFSYMASTLTLYYATDAKNDEIRMTNDKTMPNSPKGWLSAFFRFDHSFVLRHLIHIALVPLVTYEFFNVFIGFLGAFAAFFADNFAQRRIDILGHAARIAAHEKMRALRVGPLPNLRGVFLHPVLDVNFLGLIARPRAIEPCQNSLLQIRLEFISVSKIALLVLRSEKKPVFSFRPDRFSLLQIRAERRDSGSGANHDDGSLRILRQMKMFRHAREDGHGHVSSAFCEKRGANPF